MADESHYASVADATATNKRKYDEQTMPTTGRRPTGFSSPDPPRSYNSVPPPADEIQLAKQKAQEIAARLMGGADIKRPRVENNGADGGGGFDSGDKGFSYAPPNDGKSLMSNSVPSAISVSYGSYMGGGNSSKKISIPNGRVGVIIGKSGETIKNLQIESGAKIQVTRDMYADPNSPTRMVELTGTPEAIAKAEQLINDVLAEADAGGSGSISRRFTSQGGSEHYVMKIPNDKVGLVIGKGGETIKNMQARTGARIQVIPLHLPPGDTSTERNVQIDGTIDEVEAAKQLINEVISENRRASSIAGGYPQQGYQTRQPTSWGPPGGPPVQQPGYGYMQPVAYSAPSAQYNMSQPPYAGYPPQPTSGGYPSGWDQSTGSANQQAFQGYDYYNQQPASQQQSAPGGNAIAADNTAYNYNQPPPSDYNQQAQGYPQESYGGYTQSGYPPPPYDQQQGNTSASSYANVSNPTQGHSSSYGAQGESAQAPPLSSAMGQQGYNAGQQPNSNPMGYPPQGTPSVYGMPPSSQPGYGNQPPAQPGYGSSYGPGQTQQSPSTAGGYGQPTSVQPGYDQPPPTVYGPPYGAPPVGQPGYGQEVPPYNTSYDGSYSLGDSYVNSNSGGAYDGAPTSQQSVQQSVVAKASPKS